MEHIITKNTVISLTEKDIGKILDYYPYIVYDFENIKIKETDKPRAVYKVFTNDGIKCLKKVYHDESTLLFIYSIIEWLYHHNINCPRFLNTKKGLKYVRYNNNLYVLMDWIDGRKCDYDNIDDIKASSSNLAKIHFCSQSFKSIEGSNIITANKNIYESYSKHFLQILNSSNKAFYYKDTFSKLFIDNCDYYIDCAKNSLYMLSQLPLLESNFCYSICHYDYVNKNIIFTPVGDIYIIDFDKSKLDYSINDFYVYIKRILKRKNTCWNFDVFKTAVESYESIRPINKYEFQLLIAQLLFPQKFWKLSYDYYKNINICNKKSFVKLFKGLLSQKEFHEKFMEELFKYYDKKY